MAASAILHHGLLRDVLNVEVLSLGQCVTAYEVGMMSHYHISDTWANVSCLCSSSWSVSFWMCTRCSASLALSAVMLCSSSLHLVSDADSFVYEISHDARRVRCT